MSKETGETNMKASVSTNMAGLKNRNEYMITCAGGMLIHVYHHESTGNPKVKNSYFVRTMTPYRNTYTGQIVEGQIVYGGRNFNVDKSLSGLIRYINQAVGLIVIVSIENISTGDVIKFDS